VTGKWNEEVIATNLCPHDAEAVLHLHRPRNGGAEFWAWSEEKTGIYTVRSAYRMLVNHIAVGHGCSDLEQQWKKL
jgi:hypothetical protein